MWITKVICSTRLTSHYCKLRILYALTFCLVIFHLIINVLLLSKSTNFQVEYDEYNCGCPRFGKPSEPNVEYWCSEWSTIRGSNQKVISYAIYGDTTKKNIIKHYYGQIIDRLEEAGQFYPGWIVRLYHNSTNEDKYFSKLICKLYCSFPYFDPCQVKNLKIPSDWNVTLKSVSSKQSKISKNIKLLISAWLPKKFQNLSDVSHINIINKSSIFEKRLIPKMWRYIPLADSLINEFLVRDVDSYILPREIAAVNQWLYNSSTLIHVMRDHPRHNGFMLAGLWGGRKKLGGEKFTNFLKEMLKRMPKNTWDYDQVMLRRIVWPEISHSVMVHDSYHCRNPFLSLKAVSTPFPTKRNGKMFVSWGPTRSKQELNGIIKCPKKCRPKNHKDWEWC